MTLQVQGYWEGAFKIESRSLIVFQVPEAECHSVVVSESCESSLPSLLLLVPPLRLPAKCKSV